jgi:hypothetical protein
MKAIKKLVLFMLVGTVAAATYSCNKGDEQGAPNLTVTATPSSAAPGQTVKIHITSSSTGTVKKMLIEERIPGTTSYNTKKDSAVNQANFFYDYNYTLASDASGSVDIRVTVTDDKSQTTTKTATITVTGTGTLKECNSITLGAQDNAMGSSFSSSDCSVYTVTDAKNNASKVDIIYFYGATNLATVAGPSDNSFGTGTNQISSLGVQDWSVHNATMFRKITGFTWDNATVATIQAAYTGASAAEDTKANMLAVGDMVAFKTASGKYGVLRVKALTPSSTGSITIDVKTSM